jgi:hypothetical protein
LEGPPKIRSGGELTDEETTRKKEKKKRSERGGGEGKEEVNERECGGSGLRNRAIRFAKFSSTLY